MAEYVEDFGDYSVKNVKSFMGREGYGFNCTLYRKGKKVGTCMDDASGGGMYPIDWIGVPKTNATEADWAKWKAFRDEEQRLLNEHIATLPPVDSGFGGEPLTIDEGWFVTELVNKWEKDRDIRKVEKQCATKILFRTSGSKEGSYYIQNVPYSIGMAQSIRNKYGEDTEIFNEVFQQGNIPSVFKTKEIA